MTALPRLRPVWLLILAVVTVGVTGCQRQPAATSEVAPATPAASASVMPAPASSPASTARRKPPATGPGTCPTTCRPRACRPTTP
jgi:hypothetical protein